MGRGTREEGRGGRGEGDSVSNIVTGEGGS
jgi:hypothetical protein